MGGSIHINLGVPGTSNAFQVTKLYQVNAKESGEIDKVVRRGYVRVVEVKSLTH